MDAFSYCENELAVALPAVEFLQTLGGVCYQLAALDPTKERQAPEFATFDNLRDGQALAWIRDRMPRCNLYYTFNETGTSGKPRKIDIYAVRGIQVDIDPQAGKDLKSERARILASLTMDRPTGIPEATYIIDSGNGYQALWLYDRFVLGPALIGLEAQQALIDQLEAPGREIVRQLGGEAYTLDHLMRLPWTMNHPNAKKD